jgi:hypothetical protein
MQIPFVPADAGTSLGEANPFQPWVPAFAGTNFCPNGNELRLDHDLGALDEVLRR